MGDSDPSPEGIAAPKGKRHDHDNRRTVAVLVDDEWRVQAADPRVRGVLTEGLEGLIGESLFEYINPDHHDRLVEARGSIDGSMVALDGTVPVRDVTGQRSQMGISIRRLRSADSPVQFLVTFHPGGDMSGWDTQLRPTLEQRELALTGANLGIWDWDIQAGRVQRDELLTEMLGYTPDEMGDDISDWKRLVHPAGERRHNEALAEHVEAGTPYYDCEYRMRTDTGDWKWVRTIGRVVEWSEEDEPLRAVGIHQDIDDRKRAELALQEERDLFRKGPAIVFQWVDKPGWPITYVSENVGDILGYSPGELRQKPFAELVHEEDLAELEAEIAQRTEAGDRQLNPAPYRVNTADGDVRWMMGFTKRLVESDGSTPLLGYLVDITDRKRQEQKYRNLFESARDAIMVFDRESYLDYNQRALDLFGYDSGAAFLETTPWERSPPTQPDGRDSQEKALEHIERAFEEGEAFFEWTHQRTDGTTFPSEVKLSRFEYDGEPVLHALIRDISARKERERELEEREAKYRSLFEDTRDALILLDRDGFFDCNERALDLFGVDSTAEFVQRSPWDVSPATQPDGRDSEEKAHEHIELAFEEGEAFFEWTHQREDGTDFPSEVKLSKFAVDGEPALHALVRDITERKAYESELEELNQRFELALEETQTRILEWDLETDAILWDDTGQELLCSGQGAVPRTFEAFIDQVHDGDVADLRRAIDRGLQTDAEIRADFRVGSSGTGWQWVQIRGGVRYDARSRPRRIIAVLSDISARKKREQAVTREREVNRRVQQALAESRTRTDLEDLITEQLAEHGYALAWIGEPVEGELVPRSAGGGHRYLQGSDRFLDAGPAATPSVEAARAGIAQFYQRLSEQDTDWSETATRFNYRSAAAVPLVHRDVSYGVLTLYHEDPDWFDESERALIGELSETLAFAIHSLETQDTLAADRTVSVTVELAAGHYLLSLLNSTEVADVERIEVQGTVPVGEGQVLQYLDLTGGSLDRIRDTLAAIPVVEGVEVANEAQPRRLQVTVAETVPESFLAARGVVVTGTVVESGAAAVTIELQNDAAVSPTVEALDEAYDVGSVRSVRKQKAAMHGSSRDPYALLTAKQEAALKAAYHHGYFDQPRGATASEIAETLEITHSTFLQHLHRAEEKVFGAEFDRRGTE